MNQFAGVLKSGTEAVASALDTQTHGVPLVVFNPLNIARQDLVEAEWHFPDGLPRERNIAAPGGKELPAQIVDGRVLFVADMPPVGYAVYDVQPGAAQSSSTLHVTSN